MWGFPGRFGLYIGLMASERKLKQNKQNFPISGNFPQSRIPNVFFLRADPASLAPVALPAQCMWLRLLMAFHFRLVTELGSHRLLGDTVMSHHTHPQNHLGHKMPSTSSSSITDTVCRGLDLTATGSWGWTEPQRGRRLLFIVTCLCDTGIHFQ